MSDQLTPEAPEAVQQLVDRLQTESGSGATVTLIPDGYSHARSQQKFKIVVLGKNQVLLAVLQTPGVEFTQLCNKRTGANVRTVIGLKVTAQPVTPIS